MLNLCALLLGFFFLQEDTEKRGREVLTHFTYRYFTFVS
jgi:hypothetical protein